MWLIDLAISLFNILKVNTLECLSVINRECMPRPEILDVNEGAGEALFYPYNVLVNKCSGSCNTLDDPMTKLLWLWLVVVFYKDLQYASYDSYKLIVYLL